MNDEEHARVADWDGAYVLGALTPADRHAYEDHLEQCARCRDAVAELTPMPGLLAQIRPGMHDGPVAGAAGEAPTPASAGPAPHAPGPPPRDDREDDPDMPEGPAVRPLSAVPRPSSAPEVGRPRRVRRLLAGALAAAAVLVLAIALPLTLGERRADEVVSVSPVAAGDSPAPMRVDVELAPAAWGTALTITCDYPSASPAGAGPSYRDGGPPPAYALVVTAADGTRSQVSSWQGVPGEEVTLEAGTAIDLADISAVSVVDPAGAVVLTAEVDAP